MNLFRQNADILKILKFKLLATYVFLILQYLAEISRFWINATEPLTPFTVKTVKHPFVISNILIAVVHLVTVYSLR